MESRQCDCGFMISREKIMKLLEFFSKQNSDETDSQIETDLEKDVMGFILDDDEIYKEHLHTLISKINNGKKVKAEDFMKAVNQGCLKFYKDKEFNKDPNKMFPVKMRKRMADSLLTINTKGSKKDEDSRTTD